MIFVTTGVNHNCISLQNTIIVNLDVIIVHKPKIYVYLHFIKRTI